MAFLVGKGVVGGFVWFGARLWSIEIEGRAGCVVFVGDGAGGGGLGE